MLVAGAGGLAGAAAVGASLARTGSSPGSRFVVAVSQSPPVLDLAMSGSSQNVLRPTIQNVVEALVSNSPAGKIEPAVCDWSVSDDGLTYEYRVRPGVRFHTGELVTAHDIKWSHDRFYKNLPAYRSHCYDVAGVDVLDDRTVRFRFKSAGSQAPARYCYVYSQKYHDAVGEKAFGDHPVGTGPYRLTGFRSGEFADLDAFDGYWGAKPEIKHARIAYAVEDMTRVAMLRSGEADLIMAVPFPMVPGLQRRGFGRADAGVHPTFSVRFQLANPHTPWADRRVRLAIAEAIDGKTLVNGLFGGVPTRYAGFGPTEEGYDPTLPHYPYDPENAKRLLAEAGYPNGFTMPLVYFTNSYYGGRETAEAVTLYLRRIGIDVKAFAVDSAHALSFNRENGHDPKKVIVSLATAVFANFSDPVEAMRFSYGTRPSNSWYRSKAFDVLIDRATHARTPEARSAALRACMRKIHQDIPLIPLWNNVVVYMMRPGVTFTPTQHDVPLMKLEDVKLTRA